MVYESGFTGLPGIQGKFQLLFLEEVSLAGEGNSLVSPRFFPLVDFDSDLIFKGPVPARPSPSAESIEPKGEAMTASWSSSSLLHISPNFDEWANVDRVEVREATLWDFASVPVEVFSVDMNGSSEIIVGVCVDLVEIVVAREWDGVGREEPGSEGQAKDLSELGVSVLSWVTIGRGL